MSLVYGSSASILNQLLPSPEDIDGWDDDWDEADCFESRNEGHLENEDDQTQETSHQVTSTKFNRRNLCINKKHYLRSNSNSNEATRQQECSICFEEKGNDEIVVIKGCHHSFCRECVVTYLHFATQDSSLLRHNVCFYEKLNERTIELSPDTLFGVRCPQRGCQFLLEHAQIQALDNQLAERVNRFTNQQVTEEECSQSFPSCHFCNSLTIPIGLTRCDGFVCLSCKKEFCSMCFLEPHPFMNCEVYKQHLLQTKYKKKLSTRKPKTLPKYYIEMLQSEAFHHWSFGEYLKKMGVGICPTCHVAIEKNGGCNLMKCRKCNTDFGWNTSEKLEKSTQNHWYSFPKSKHPGFTKAYKLHTEISKLALYGV